MCQVNISITFSGKPIGYEEFFTQMVEALDVTIDRHPKKEDLAKWKAEP